MTLLTFLSLKFLISVMQCGNTSLMDISEDLFSESFILVVASDLTYSYFHIDWYWSKTADGWDHIL